MKENNFKGDYSIPRRPDNFGRKVEVGFLLREGFSGGRRGKTSGWEYVNISTEEKLPSGYIFDDSDDHFTALFKRFLKQEDTKFTVDLIMTLRGKNKGSRIAVKSGDLDTALLVIDDDKLAFIGPDGKGKDIAVISPGELTGIRIDFNLKEGIADIWVNGKIKLKAQKLTTEINTADRIYFGSIEKGVSDFVINAIEIYKGFSLYENLFITPVSGIPDNWTCACTGGSSCESHAYGKMVMGMEFMVFKLSRKSTADICKIESGFEIAGSGVYEYDFFLDDASGGISVKYSGKSGGMEFYTKGGDLFFKSSALSSEVKVISDVKKRVWYRIQLLLDSQNRKLTVNTNGYEGYAAEITGPILEGVFSKIEIAEPEGTGDIMVDRICVKPMLDRRAVPKPDIADTGDLTVNMQVCNLWREGTHAGWRVYTEKYLERKPILGWYDEGDAEVADWEIKWALEHGIKSYMYCWYRPHIGAVPIKQGYLDEQLWDGLFNSTFKKDFKFSIMFTNHNVFNIESADDMVENVMPYMIEVFFRNPNYLKTSDNKPILYIYEMRELLIKLGDPNIEGSLGTPEQVSVMFDRMREMTVKAGFGGLLILGEYRGKDPDFINKMAHCGYDYIFAYTWHPEYKEISQDGMLSQIQSYLRIQRELIDGYGVKTKVIPNVSVAWDPTAWNRDAGRDPGTTFTFNLEHLEALLKWERDEYGTPVLDDGGMKMIMIDNWNEYGEGHYFMPAYGTPAYYLDEDGRPGGKKGKQGFGWLDCIRRIYGKGKFEHTDLWPLDEGFGPYDKWFPMAWDEENVPEIDMKKITSERERIND